jgi:predicted nuclease of predicted toxin-antitoxin system
MQIIVDECVASSTIQILISLQFEVLTVDSILNYGTDDESIFNYAADHQIPLITHDRRFGSLFYYSSVNPPTTIVLEVISPHPTKTNQRLDSFLRQIDLNDDHFYGKLIIISHDKIRVRSRIFD